MNAITPPPPPNGWLHWWEACSGVIFPKKYFTRSNRWLTSQFYISRIRHLSQGNQNTFSTIVPKAQYLMLLNIENCKYYFLFGSSGAIPSHVQNDPEFYNFKTSILGTFTTVNKQNYHLRHAHKAKMT